MTPRTEAAMQRTIKLDDEQARTLEWLAARDQRSVDELLQLAVSDYLARRGHNWSDWNRRFDAFVDQVRARVPRELSPEEIEAEITANWQEYRAERAACSYRDKPASTDAGLD
jgi:predicted transcriptional regulator